MEVGIFPPSLKKLRFNTFDRDENDSSFDQPIMAGVLNEGLEEIEFGDYFNQLISPDILPSTIRSVKFGEYFESSNIVQGSFPSSLTYINFSNISDEFNDILLPDYAFSEGIKSLTIESDSPTFFHPRSLPISIRTLHLMVYRSFEDSSILYLPNLQPENCQISSETNLKDHSYYAGIILSTYQQKHYSLPVSNYFIHKEFYPIPFERIAKEYKTEEKLKNLFMNYSRDIHESNYKEQSQTSCSSAANQSTHHSLEFTMREFHDLPPWSVDDKIIISPFIQIDHPVLFKQFQSKYYKIVSVINQRVYMIKSEEKGWSKEYLVDRLYFKRVERMGKPKRKHGELN